MKANSPNLMTRPRWTVVWVVVGLIVLAVGIRYWRASPALPRPSSAPLKGAPQPPASPAVESPFLTVEGSQLAGVDDAGRKQWELRARTLQIDKQKDTVTLTEVSGQLYQAGASALLFAAPRAVFFVGSRDVELSGGVVGRTPEGRMLTAPRVRWDARRQQFTASGGVTVTQPGMVIRADTVTSDAVLQQTTFTGNIKVTVTQ